jgi:hypothetical protein
VVAFATVFNGAEAKDFEKNASVDPTKQVAATAACTMYFILPRDEKPN